jgi:hypothetical protein
VCSVCLDVAAGGREGVSARKLRPLQRLKKAAARLRHSEAPASESGRYTASHSSASGEIEEKDFGLVHALQLESFFGGDCGAIAGFELLAVECD